MSEQEQVRCHACGKQGCPSMADPVGGPFMLHNRAAYALAQKVGQSTKVAK